jgi:RNase P protein component
MADENTMAITAALRDIRDRVGDILKDSPTCGRPAGEILQALARIEDATFGNDSASQQLVCGRARGELARKRNQSKRYIREYVGGSEVLAEYRDENRIPLRSPGEILETVVGVLSRAADPMLFGDIQKALGEQSGDEPPEYQTRIALRFLASPGIGLVTRRQTRYSAVDARKIRRVARQAWESLASP